MSVLRDLLKDIAIPKMYLVEQKFNSEKIHNIERSLKKSIANASCFDDVKSGMKIGITAGSRGIRNMPQIIKVVVECIKSKGAYPFIIPAMGSHGGATSLGQKQVLESMGISEDYCGAPILSSMNAVNIGKTECGVQVYMDEYALNSDGVIVINRIKPHVGFRGPYESGVAKMIVIGLGKQLGAEACHAKGFGYMAKNIPEAALVSLNTGKILCGIGILENAYDETQEFHILCPDEILKLEPALQEKAKQLMPKFFVEPLDILVVEEIGKNITGTGMDTNIIGRYHTPYISGGPTINKIVVNSLTAESHGNANGIGLADFTTNKFFEDMSFEHTYPNSLTSTVQDTIKIPMVLENPLEALKGAIKTCGNQDINKIRLAYIRNTLDMGKIFYSTALYKEICEHKDLAILEGPWDYETAQNYFRGRQPIMDH